MTETTKVIFEKYQVRKNKKQKAAFREYVKNVSEGLGYTYNVEKGSLGAKNIVIGDPDSAKVVYTAHYDTCAVLPFPNFITPKNISIYLLYNLAVVIGAFLIMAVVGFGFGMLMGAISLVAGTSLDFIADFGALIIDLLVLGLVLLMLFGPANKHTANDNTSGVTTLLDLMAAMPEEQRAKAAFVFFDLEEMGTFGSAGFASKHKKTMKEKLVVNFDCVSDGDNFIFTVPKKAHGFVPVLEEAYKSDVFNTEVLTKGYFYPSDQANFKCGIGVAALKKSKGGILYMNRIHTKKDVIYQEANIEYLVEGSLRLTKAL